jgi:hypothetical protein
METSLCAKPNPRKKVAGKDAGGSRIGGAERHCELP